MLPEEQKKKNEEMEKWTESGYYKYLVKEQIKAGIRDIVKAYKWYAYLVLALAVAFLGSVGIQVNNWKDNIGENAKEIDQLADSTRKEMKRFASLELKNFTMTWNASLDSIKLLSEAQLTNMLVQAKEHRDDFESSRAAVQATLEDESEMVRNAISDYKTTKARLDSLRQVMADELVVVRAAEDSLLRNWSEIRATSSIRYLFVERGNRTPLQAQYRPVTIQLPYSDLFITALFFEWDKFKDKQYSPEYQKTLKLPVKEASVDLIITDSKGYESRKYSKILKEHEPTPLEDTNYQVEAIFIYMPPNLPLPFDLYVVPDFVVLKVSLKSEELKSPAKFEIKAKRKA
jgi:ribosomal protein S17E